MSFYNLPSLPGPTHENSRNKVNCGFQTFKPKSLPSWKPQKSLAYYFSCVDPAQPTVSPIIFSTNNLSSEEHLKKTKNPEVLLTTKERECLKFVGEGYTSKEIARYFNLSPRTVEWHVENIKHKLGVDKKTDLIKVVSQATFMLESATVRLERKIPSNPNKQPNIK